MSSFFSKMGSSLRSGLDSAMDYMGGACNSLLSKKYPEIEEVLDTLTEMKATYVKSDDVDGDGEPDGEDDGKWRPMLLTLGLLYKLQRIQDSHADSWYNHEDIFVTDDDVEKRLLNTFGFYWHTCMKVAGALRQDQEGRLQERAHGLICTISFCRTINNKGKTEQYGEDGQLLNREDIFNQVVESTGLSRENVIFAHATDSLHVDKHCPDFSVVVLHEIKQVRTKECLRYFFLLKR